MTYMYMYKKVYKLCHGTIMCAIVEPVADICVCVSLDQALLTTSTGDEGTDGAEEVTREEQLQAASAEPVQLSDVTVTTPPDYRTIVVYSCTHNIHVQFNSNYNVLVPCTDVCTRTRLNEGAVLLLGRW